MDVFKPMVKGKRSTRWYGKVFNPVTKKYRKVALGVTDKQVARKLLKEAQEREEKLANGMIDTLSEQSLQVILSVTASEGTTFSARGSHSVTLR